MNLRTAVSISWVVTPGRTREPASARAWAVSRPARRMQLDFAGGFERDHFHLVHFPSSSMIFALVSSMPPRSGTRFSTPLPS